MNDQNTEQQVINKQYSDLLLLLNEAHNSLDSLSPANDDIRQYVSIFKDILIESIDDIRKRIEEIQTCMVWDHLVVALFGSTNAGKSTIIETLRLKYEENKSDGDGEIVGTGEQDFTERFEEYELSINGKKLTLIDMPGILSDEEKYKRQIHSALNKAHLVFYVDRDGTTPDVETVKKIRAYLQDWVKVYTIYNVSGFEKNGETLQNEKVKESACLIEKGYANALGTCYAGNITLHAFFALASVAKFSESRSDLVRKQASSLKKFDSPDMMFAYSEFSSLINLILIQVENYKEEILAANKQRLSAITSLTRKSLSDELKKQLQKQREIPIELKKFKNDISRYYGTAVDDIHSTCDLIINKHIQQLNNECKGLVDKGEKDDLKNKCEYLQTQSIKTISKEQQQCVSEIIRQLSSNIERRKRKLENFIPKISVQSSYNHGQARIDFQGAEACVKFNLENIMDILVDIASGASFGFVAGSALPVIGNVIGTLLGGLGGLGKGLYESFWGNSYKKQAKDAIETAMNQLNKELCESSEIKVNITIGQIITQRDLNLQAIDKEIEKISKAVKIVDISCDNLKKLEKELYKNS